MTGSTKILQLGKFYPILGGVEKVMYDTLLGLSGRGVDTTMLCASFDGPPREITPAPHARILCTCTWFKACATMISPAMVTKLRRICNEYAVVHIHHPDPMAALALRCSGYRGKVVLHWHSDIEKQKNLLKLYRPLQKWLLRRADIIVGTSQTYLENSPFLKGFEKKFAAVPIGVDPIEPDPEQVALFRSRWPGKKIVFSLGRLVPYKGFQHLIDAAKQLPEDTIVLIGGTGPLRDELQSRIGSLGLQDRVKLLGRIPDAELPTLFGACDLFCLSSVFKTEAFGIVQIEAMSCGRPIVATTIPGSGVSWVNAHGISGLNVPPADPTALAGAITRILSDRELQARLSAGASHRYLEMFRKDTMVSGILKVYARAGETIPETNQTNE